MERLVIVDPGDTVTRAWALDPAQPGGAPVAIEIESAAASVYVRPSSCDPDVDAEPPAGPPPIVGMGEAGGFFEVGAAAADREGYGALLAARPTAEKLEALVRAVLFALAHGGDRVKLVLVADPGEKADRLEEVAESLAGSRPITAVPRAGGPIETRRLAIEARTVAAGEALLERACAHGDIDERSGPALALDLGHRSTRLYLLDPTMGAVDHDLIPHGGESFIEHARRFAREKGVEPDEVAILREARAGLEALTLGGLTFPVRRFFALPAEEVAKAIAGAVAERLRRQLERGGRWPGALLLAGGLAAPCAATVAARLAERGLAIARTRVIAVEDSPLLEGALLLARGGAPVP
jgi:hypothetical protein